MADYVNELLFFKGFSLEIMTEESALKQLTLRPVIISDFMDKSGDNDHAEQKVPDGDNDHAEQKVPDGPQRGSRVVIYLPRASKDDNYDTIDTYLIGQPAPNSGKHHVQHSSLPFPLEVMEEEVIKNECPQKAVIIAAKETVLKAGDPVKVYIPYLKMDGTVTHVDSSGPRKKLDVLYDFPSSKKAKQTRFFAKALELWKKIPADFKYPGFFPVKSSAAHASVGAASPATDASVSDISNDSEFDGMPQTKKVRKDLNDKGISLSYLWDTLKKHGVDEEKGQISLYAWKIFPDGHNAVDYMAQLVKKETPPLQVLAAYLDVLAKIKNVKEAKLREQLQKAFRERDHVASLEIMEKLDEHNNAMLEVHLYDIFSGEANEYPDIRKLMEAIDGSTNEDKLKEELAKSKPKKAIVQILEDKIKKDKAQLKNRQKPFQQWLNAFATIIDGDGEFGNLGEWEKTLNLLDKEQQERRKEMIKTLSENKSKADAIMKKDEPSTTRMHKKLEQGAKELLKSFDAPISLPAAYHKRIFSFLFSLMVSLFIVLSYDVFGGGKFTLESLVLVQAGIFGIFYDSTKVDALELFEKESIKAALAYHVNCFRTVYTGEYQQETGRLLNDKFKWCTYFGSFSTFGLAPRCDHSSRYHKWRAMALFKMLQDRKTS